MPILKLYFKLLKNGLPILFLYIIIFLLSAHINIGGLLDYDREREFNIAVINENPANKISRNFIEYLSRYGDIYYYKEENKELEEDLYHGKISSVVMIPYQFGEKFLAGEEVHISLKSKGSLGGIDFFIKEYLNRGREYISHTENMEEETFLKLLSKDLEEHNITIINLKAISNVYSNYYNIAGYILMACVLYGVNFVMRTYQDRDIQRRITLSLQNENKMQKQIFFGNLAFTVGMVFIFIVTDRIINREIPYTVGVFLLQIKFILYALSSLALGYVIAALIQKKELQNIVIHSLPLIFALFSGVFIPREELRGILVKISVFTPMYWFINGNRSLGEVDSFQPAVLREILYDSMHLLCFFGAMFAFVLLVEKYKRQMDYN